MGNKDLVLYFNRNDWEKRYLHENYSLSLEEGFVPQQPCPDVFWFPIISDRFADELVAEMEAFGAWSDGTNKVGLNQSSCSFSTATDTSFVKLVFPLKFEVYGQC